MKTIPYSLFSGTTEQLQARVDAFRAARAAHAKTVGVPAPREEDFIEQLERSGQPFEVEPAPPPPPTKAELAAAALEAHRAAALFAIQRPQIEAAAAARRAGEEQLLEAAMADPNAPLEVKDYAAALLDVTAPERT